MKTAIASWLEKSQRFLFKKWNYFCIKSFFIIYDLFSLCSDTCIYYIFVSRFKNMKNYQGMVNVFVNVTQKDCTQYLQSILECFQLFIKIIITMHNYFTFFFIKDLLYLHSLLQLFLLLPWRGLKSILILVKLAKIDVAVNVIIMFYDIKILCLLHPNATANCESY